MAMPTMTMTSMATPIMAMPSMAMAMTISLTNPIIVTYTIPPVATGSIFATLAFLVPY